MSIVVWKSGRSSRLLLLDCDATTRRSADGVRQLNTLAHYNITDHATFILVNHRSLTQRPPGGSSPVTRTINGTGKTWPVNSINRLHLTLNWTIGLTD